MWFGFVYWCKRNNHWITRKLRVIQWLLRLHIIASATKRTVKIQFVDNRLNSFGEQLSYGVRAAPLMQKHDTPRPVFGGFVGSDVSLVKKTAWPSRRPSRRVISCSITRIVSIDWLLPQLCAESEHFACTNCQFCEDVSRHARPYSANSQASSNFTSPIWFQCLAVGAHREVIVQVIRVVAIRLLDFLHLTGVFQTNT